MDKTVQSQEYARAGLSPTDVCLKAVKAYKTLCDDNLWEPKKLPKDRHTPSVANLNLASINKALNLGASFNNSNDTKRKKNIKCFNCGKMGHGIFECTEPENKALKQKLQDKFMSEKRGNNNKSKSWKKTPPKAGESQVKTVFGKEVKWCDKYKLWTYTHNNQSHQDDKKKKSKKKSVSFAESNLMICEPTAWLVEANTTSNSPSIKHYILFYVYFCLTVAILLGLPLDTFSLLHSSCDLISIRSFISIHMNSSSIIKFLIDSFCYLGKLALPFLSPILWMSLGITCAFMSKLCSKPFNPITDIPHLPRQVRRSISPAPQPKLKLKSAKDFNLSPKYPLRLRKEHKFHPRSSTPTIREKESLEFFDNFLSECQHSNNFKPKRKQLQSQKWKRYPPSTCPHPPKVSHQASKLVSNVHKSKGRMKKYQAFNAFKKPKGGAHCNFDQDRSKSFRHQRSNSSFCNHHKPNRTSRAKVSKPRYVLQGLTTVNDVPNMNLTSAQRKCIDEIASMFLNATQITNKLRSIAQDITQLSPSTFRSAINSINNSYQFDVIWDSGASVCISPSKEDFLDYDTNVDIKNVAGVNGKITNIIGQGTVGWSIFDVNGKLRHFELKAYHIPSSKARLISTSALLHK